jgi:V/A-type H+-transporting ATPase subunit A
MSAPASRSSRTKPADPLPFHGQRPQEGNPSTASGKTLQQPSTGRILALSGSVVRAALDTPLVMRELVYVGAERLIGEVVVLDGREASIQVYEETSGLRLGDPVSGTGQPLTIELGPGLLGNIFDGVQRPLAVLAREGGDFIGRGRAAAPLDRARVWMFEPRVAVGDQVAPGQAIGVVQETAALAHPILVPPDVAGRVATIADAGPRRVTDVVARVGERDLTLIQRWRARRPRPFLERMPLDVPLVTGQRVLDTFFPLARGTAAAMPGGFGTGKTVTQHQLCRYAHADVIVFVGCGERGNEITHLLRELPELIDPRTQRLLAERTILIANTSNMPVSAREASIFTGVTVGEYYRDLGYHVLLLADSLSRWAEALREISGRLEEMPAEEGYPPYLSTALAGFYERAGRVVTLGGAEGSLTIISAISPPAGDLTEPVTRHAQRFVRTFWTLDRQLAAARVFPAVSMRDSYSEVPVTIAPEWRALRAQALEFLEQSARAEETARLVGSDALPERERTLLRRAGEFQQAFLAQNAFDPEDAYCPPEKQIAMLRAFFGEAADVARAVSQEDTHARA